MSKILNKVWSSQKDIFDIQRQIEYNKEHNKRLESKWEEKFQSLENLIVANDSEFLEHNDTRAVIDTIRRNAPCQKIG